MPVKKEITVAAGGKAPEVPEASEEGSKFILSMPEAVGFVEMDPEAWKQWIWMLTCGHHEGEHAIGLLWQAHNLAEQYHFAKARKAGLPELETAEKKWIIASILMKLLEEHNVFGDCRYPHPNRDHERARSSNRVPERYRYSKHAGNRKVFPFQQGKGMERIRPNPYAPPVYTLIEKNGYE